ncbi:MAG: sensory rhodopsin transducer [Ruminococcaceae bacterium]|nr:sensory rhodopsin transducer [Oscillospiraceae bacterium]
MQAIGKKNWIIPDCELPREGEGELKGHESVIIVNAGKEDVQIDVTVFFPDAPAYHGIKWTVKAESVRCFRMNNLEDMCGFEVPLETQYAMGLEATGNIVLQYGRLDNRQVNLAYYTTLGYGE